MLLVGLLLKHSLVLFLFYNLGCTILFYIDTRISTGASSLVVQRIGDASLSIYEQESIGFLLHNKGTYEVKLQLKDDIPEFHFQADDRVMRGTLLPNEKKEFSYTVTPTKRGAYAFDVLNLKCEGRLGLCQKIWKINLPQEYKVYPNLENIRKYRLNVTNNRLHKQGQRNLRALGHGTAFESLREYTVGDDYRRMNWQATARKDRPIINQYEPEKNQHVHLMIDTGRPMSHTIKGYRKLDLVINAALVLADLVNQNGDKSGLLLFGSNDVSMLRPGSGPAHRSQMLETLYHIEATNKTSDYRGAFQHFKTKEKHRSIVFLFTDFDLVEEAEEMMKTLPLLARNNIVILILMKNEALQAKSCSTAKTREELFEKGVALELLRERRKMIHLLNHRGILCIECDAEHLEYTVINKYIQTKNSNYM